jgi:hypothetical protein
MSEPRRTSCKQGENRQARMGLEELRAEPIESGIGRLLDAGHVNGCIIRAQVITVNTHSEDRQHQEPCHRSTIVCTRGGPRK